MRIVIFSDIHGNIIGLDAVLEDIANSGSLDVKVNGRRAINVGSVSNPKPPDLRASYVILESDESGYQIHFRRVDYDRAAVIDQLIQIRHPASEWIIRHFRG